LFVDEVKHRGHGGGVMHEEELMSHVVPFTPADRERVIALVLGIQRGEFGVPITLEDQPDLADVPRFYQVRRGGFWVAKEGEEVVGTIGLLDEGEAALRKMFVRKDRRGPEHGVAPRLLEALVAHAREKGLPRLYLGTRPEMRAAHRFYEKHGFVRLGEADLPPAFPRMTLDSVFYCRVL
jgi:ribosomal protein S18 acetylase RimI-like enzyme